MKAGNQSTKKRWPISIKDLTLWFLIFGVGHDFTNILS